MQNSKMMAIRNFYFLLFDGFSNHCLANAVEPLRAANTILGERVYSWEFLSIGGAPVESSSGLPVSPGTALDRAAGDVLMVMPSYGFRNLCNYSVRRALLGASKRFGVLGGLDTGSWLLADAGLLDGYQATIHFDEFVAFEETFEHVDAARVRFLLDRDRITCAGAAATFDLALELISRDFGTGVALEVFQLFMVQGAGASTPFAGFSGDKLIARAIELMSSNCETHLPIAELATALGCSQRTLESRVKRSLKITPQKLYTRLRLGQARKLLQDTDMKISEISLRCGYENPSAMTRAFQIEYAMTPREMRKRSKFFLPRH